MAFSQAGQYGPEALLDSAGNALLGASVAAPAGYTATVDQYANLTVVGPPAASVPVVVTRAGGVAFTVNVPVAPAVAELSEVRDLATAASSTYVAHGPQTDLNALLASLPVGTEYVWHLTDGNGVLLDIVSGKKAAA